MPRTVKKGEIYRHFKGNLYQIVGIAKDSETQKDVVIYQALYGDMGLWVRPYDMFLSEVDHEKYPEVTQKYRFELLSQLACNNAPEPAVSATPTTHVTNEIPVTSKMPEEKKAEFDSTGNNADSEDTPDERLLKFLDSDTYKEKLDCLAMFKKTIDDRLINDIAAALDLTVDEGDIETRYRSLRSALEILAKFECNRLR